MGEDLRLAAYFAQVSEDLLTDASDLTFERVVKRAVEVVPGADHCGITLRQRRGRAGTIASTGDLVDRVDGAQYDLDEGPSLEAAYAGDTCVVVDLRTDERWPRWRPVALDTGLRSALCICLRSGSEVLGSLNLYATRPGIFDGETVDIALIFAVHAAEALTTARLVTNLQAALESRHSIGLAQGVLAVRYDVSFETAFTVLQRYSNDTNTKLRDVARMVLETRSLPGMSAGDRDPQPARRQRRDPGEVDLARRDHPEVDSGEDAQGLGEELHDQ